MRVAVSCHDFAIQSFDPAVLSQLRPVSRPRKARPNYNGCTSRLAASPRSPIKAGAPSSSGWPPISMARLHRDQRAAAAAESGSATRDPISGSSGCAIRQPSTSQDENPAKPRSLGSSATAAANRARALVERRRTVAGEGPHQADPRALVGDGRAQREALAERRLAFDAPQAPVARQIGSSGDVDLLGAERARPRFDRGDDVAEICSTRRRGGQRALRDRRGLDRERDLRRIGFGAQPREQRAGVAQGQPRPAFAQIVDDAGGQARRDRRSRPRRRLAPPRSCARLRARCAAYGSPRRRGWCARSSS